MKKIFALALAALMTAGMTTTALALVDGTVTFNSETAPSTFTNTMIVDHDDDGVFESADVPVIATSNGVFTGFERVDYGKKVAIILYDTTGGTVKELVNEDALRGWRVKADWSVGKVDEKADFELVKYDNRYVYAVTFTVPDFDELKTEDVAGSITIYKNTTDQRAPQDGGNKVYLGVEYGYSQSSLGALGGDITGAEVVEFTTTLGGSKLEGEEILYTNDFEFEVDVTGQGKLNLKNNTKFNKEFAAMYDYANIDFLTFEYAPSFNKIGTFYLYAPEDAFIYEVTEDGAKEIAGLKWNEDYEAWEFRTRTLKAYAISDVELDEKTVTEDKDDASSTTDGGKENPDTGR